MQQPSRGRWAGVSKREGRQPFSLFRVVLRSLGPLSGLDGLSLRVLRGGFLCRGLGFAGVAGDLLAVLALFAGHGCVWYLRVRRKNRRVVTVECGARV